jgi:hypothetical protein
MSAGSGVDWILAPSSLEVLGREGLEWNGFLLWCPPPNLLPLTTSPSIRVYVIFLNFFCVWVRLNLNDIPLFWQADA